MSFAQIFIYINLFADCNQGKAQPYKARCQKGEVTIRTQLFPSSRVHLELRCSTSGTFTVFINYFIDSLVSANVIMPFYTNVTITIPH